MRRRARSTKVRRPGMGQAMTGVPAHLAWIHQHRQRAMRGGMVMLLLLLLLHGRVVGLRRAFMKNRRPRMVERAPMVMGVVSVRLLALIGRMRVLW